MKKLRLISIAFAFINGFFTSHLKAQSGLFQIFGKIEKIPFVEKVLIRYQGINKSIMDSANVTNGSYVFTGRIAEPQAISIWVKYFPDENKNPRPRYKGVDLAEIYIQPSMVQISSIDTFSKMKISGAKWNDDYQYLKSNYQLLQDSLQQLRSLYTAYDINGEKDSIQWLNQQIPKVLAVLNENIMASYIKAHPESPLSVWALSIYAGNGKSPMEYDKVMHLYQLISADVKKNPLAIDIKQRLSRAENTIVGKRAPNFILSSPSGKKISLSSFKGRYVLIDFWASWCAPCRAENPNVLKTYNQFKNKNFTVLGISIDEAKEPWLKAIREDKLTWTQVLDFEKSVAKTYDVRAIPNNFLINPEGVIVARGLRGEEFYEKLKEILGE